MSKVITVMNMKGGVGKTTVTMHLAGIFARYKLGKSSTLRVLAIDYDPQFNLSQAFLPASKYFELEKARKTTISILLDDDAKLNPYELQVPGNHTPPAVKDLATTIYKMTTGTTLDLIPSTLDLMYVALGQATVQTKPIEERFKKFIDNCKENYDLIFIDCHPAGSLFTKTSLRNSDHVIIPVMPQRYAVRGIGLMMNFISSKKEGSAGPEPLILFNHAHRYKVSSQEKEIRSNSEYSKYCMTKTLKRYKAFSDPEEGKGFVWVSGSPYSTEAFNNLVDVATELRERIGV